MTSQKKGLKIAIIVVLAVFVIFMGLSAVMYFIKPAAVPQQPTGDETTTVDIVSDTGAITTGQL